MYAGRSILTALGAAITIAAPAPAAAQGINVFVNSDAVAFPGQPPVQRFGTVLVPLRGVFEKLGASVQYDGATKTILAVKGPTTVSLRLGESQALVNGREQALSVPAQATGGTTLVPLRFVSEALGAQVKWDGATRTVLITTDAQVAAELPAPQGSGPVTGTITGVFPESNSVSVRVSGGQNTQISLAPDALVLVTGAEGPGTVAGLNTLRAGDQVTVRRDAQGRATRLDVSYDERRGEVKSIVRIPSTGDYLVTLTDGSSVEVAGDAPISMAGNRVQMADIHTGEPVVIRVNPLTKKGIGLAVATADRPNPTPPAKVEVRSLTHDATRSLRAGDVLTVTLRGTPGAAGTFSIPGIEAAQSLSLRENSPGVYTGAFTVPAGINIREASVLASLNLRGTQSNLIQSGAAVTIDSAGPTLTKLTPDQDATLPPGKPLIYGTYTDAGAGVDTRATRLIVNGQDVSDQATITEAFFSYRPAADLGPGRNTAVIIVRDGAGNETRRDWQFTVSAAETPIKSLTVTPEGKTLEAGDVLTVRLEAAPGGVARFNIGGAVTDRPLREESPGVYTGTYTVKKGDSLAKAPVSVTFAGSGGRAVTQTAAQSVTINAGTPDTPIIDSPQQDAAVGGTVTITGRAAPGATVRYTIRYQGRLLGVLERSGTVADGEAVADAQGKWTTQEIRLTTGLLGGSVSSYTVQAVTVDAAGNLSEPATVQFRR